MPIAIQNRVLLGITFFIGIMLLVGWVAINEGGRMAVFTDQYNGRSIENGAAIFLNNCSTCHGVDGKGIAGKAPALNNPMLFLDKNPAQDTQNKVNDLQKQLDSANQQVSSIADNQKQLDTLNQQIAAETDATKKAQLQDQATKLKTAVDRAQAALPDTQKTIDTLKGQLDQANKDLQTLKDQGWDASRQTRLKELGWGGTLKQYIANAVAAGRPLSVLYWPQAMPTWGQTYGGPLRADEVDDVANYVLNFRDTALKLTPKDVNQQLPLPTAGNGQASAGGANDVTTIDPNNAIFKKIGKDPANKVDALTDLTGGDPARGQQLYAGYGCVACHMQSPAQGQGPNVNGTWYRVLTERVKDPANAGLDGEHYVAQSILYPNAYVVPNYPSGLMPQNFGDRMDEKNLKDIIAYLETQKTP